MLRIYFNFLSVYSIKNEKNDIDDTRLLSAKSCSYCSIKPLRWLQECSTFGNDSSCL